MTNLGFIQEYDNINGFINGIDGLAEEIAGAISTADAATKKAMLTKLNTNVAFPSRGSRAEMEKFKHELSANIKQLLVRGDLRFADNALYSTKLVGSKTIKLFETQDDKETSLRNISNSKLPKNQAFLASGIVLLAGKAISDSKDDIMSTKFESIEKIPALANGEFSLASNKRQIVPETPNWFFCTDNSHVTPLGYYKLANPRIIHDDLEIQMTIELGTMAGIDAHTYVKAIIHGTTLIP